MLRNKNLFLYSSVISVNCISLYGGGSFSWTSPIIPRLRSNDTSINPLGKPITLFEETGLSSLFVLGTLLGAFFSMTIANKIGRKKTLVLFGGGFLAAYSSFIFIYNIIWYLWGRLIIGLGVGCIVCILPSFVGEIADDSTRGITGSIFGTANAIGHMLNFCIAPFVSFQVWNIINIIPGLLFFLIFVPLVPESPYYFVAMNDTIGAKRSLRKFRGHTGIGKELEVITNSVENAQKESYNSRDLFQSDVVRRCLVIGCGLMICQPLTGYNCVTAYLQPIFNASDGFISSKYSVMIVGICNVISNISATFLVARFGRKTLLILATTGSAVCLMLLGTFFYLKMHNFNVNSISWLPTVSTLVYIFINNLGFGSVPFIICAEIYPLNAKTVGNGISSIAHTIIILLIMSIFPYISWTLGMSSSFWIFTGAAVSALLFIIFTVPETKGKSFAEIQDLLKR